MKVEELQSALSRSEYCDRNDYYPGHDEPCSVCGDWTLRFYYKICGEVVCDCDECVKAIVESMYEDYVTGRAWGSWEEYLDDKEGVRRRA